MSARHWVAAARPATLWAGVVPVAVGTALAAADGPLDRVVGPATLLVSVALQLASNFANDLADGRRGVDGPDRVGPARALASGWLTESQLLRATVICIATALVAGAWLVAHGGWVYAAMGVLAVACAVAYTAGPLPLGYLGLGDALVMLFFGVIAVCGTYHLQRGTLTQAVVVASIAVGALATAILAVNNLRDRHTDAKARKWTLAARFGGTFARAEHTVLIAGAFLGVAIVALTGRSGWWLPWLALPPAAALTRQVWLRDGSALNPLLGATAKLEVGFGALLCIGVLL